MSFLTPWAFAGLAALVPVILLYFLKLRRKKVPVSSTWLWVRSIQDLRVNAPFQRLRKSLLLLLQVLLLLALVFALARPRGAPEAAEGKAVVLLIDRSASMSAKEGDATRLERALEAARGVVAGLEDADAVMVIPFAGRPSSPLPFTRDRRAIEAALAAIRPADTPTRITEALQMAVASAASVPNAKIVVVSDGGFEDVAVPTEAVSIEFIAVGREPVNAAVTGIEVRRPESATEPWIVFAQVDLFAREPRELTIELHVNDGLHSVKSMSLDPGGTQPALFEVVDPVPEVVQVRISEEDDLAVDNQAWSVVRSETARLLLVTAGNFFLERALAELPHAEVDRVAPAGLAAVAPDTYDVAIFDAIAPPGLPPGRYFFLGALPAWEGIAGGADREEPPIVDWDRRHPITRRLELGDLYVKKAAGLTVPDFAVPLVDSATAPLVFAWEKDRTRAVVVAFDLLDSNWPLRLSFPLFIANAVEWLRRDPRGDWRVQPPPGEPLRVRFDPGETRVEIATPAGDRHELSGEAGGEAVFGETDRAGLYRVRHADGREERVARNLLDPVESRAEVRAEIRLRDERVEARPAAPPPLQEWWRPLAWLALVLLLVEWWVYHRRIELF